jgi:hypothetical protein
MTTGISAAIAQPPGDGWVRFPAARTRRTGLLGALRGTDKDDDLTGWAAATARELPGPQADPGLTDTYTVMLAELAASGRKRGLLLGYAWLPGTTGPVAQIDVSMLHATRARTGLTVDMLEQQFSHPDPGTVEFEVSKVQLPAGPALRTRQVWQAGDSPSDTALSVTYACLPPEIGDAVMYTMYWTLPDDDPRLTEIADSLATTLRITT